MEWTEKLTIALLGPLDESVLRGFLETLTPRENQVIKLRFGIDREKPLLLREIGELYNVGPERIRQIETKALRKMHMKLRDISIRYHRARL